MARFRPSSTDCTTAADGPSLVKALAPEDIRAGDYVTPLYQVFEFPSFFWCSDASLLPVDEPVRIQFVPACGGMPMKVKSICLPFVLVKSPNERKRTLDVRSCRLARLDDAFAHQSWKVWKGKRSKSKGK